MKNDNKTENTPQPQSGLKTKFVAPAEESPREILVSIGFDKDIENDFDDNTLRDFRWKDIFEIINHVRAKAKTKSDELLNTQRQQYVDAIAKMRSDQADELKAMEDFFAAKHPKYDRFRTENKNLRETHKAKQAEFREIVETFKGNIANIKMGTPKKYLNDLITVLNQQGVPDLRGKQFKEKRQTSTGIYETNHGKDIVTVRYRLIGHPTDIAAAAVNIGMLANELIMSKVIFAKDDSKEVGKRIDDGKREAAKVNVEKVKE